MAKITVQKIQNLNTLVIRQKEGRLFLTTQDSIIISVPYFAEILKFLIQNDYLSKKVVEGILMDVDTK